MSKVWQWVLGICVVLITLAVVATMVVPLFLPQAAAAGWGTVNGMGPGHMFGGRGEFGGPMMGGGFGRMGGFFGIGMFLGPLFVLALLVAGVVVLVRALRPRPAAGLAAPAPAAPAAAAPCAHCSQPLQAGWKVCPYCGEKI